MKFDDLDTRMRIYETAADRCVLPGIFIVARIDGRGFTRLTKEVHPFEAPFDERFRDMMVATVEHVMTCGFNVLFGFTQSDEINLLFHRDDNGFGRKTRKINSVLAGEASAKFSLLLGHVAAFDCRVCELPRPEDVRDYFRWRQEDAHRNALGAHAYWHLRKAGQSVAEATAQLLGMNAAAKNELLFQAGINFNDLPAWQKRGVGLLWKPYEKQATNPKTGQPVTAIRRRVEPNFELPMRDDFDRFILALLGD